MGEQPRDLFVQRVGLGEVHHADRAAADLVLVSGADAALGGADLHAIAGRLLAMRVELAVQREDQRRVLGDLEIIGGYRDALLAQPLDLADEEMRIDDDAIADDRELARPHDAGGQQRELIGLAVDDQRMAGVVAALEAHHDIGLEREPVDDLAFAFVAPLGADHDHIRHGRCPPLVT